MVKEALTTREPFLLFTQVSCSVVPAVSTFSSVGVTQICMAITLTGATAGEAPLAGLAV